MNQNLFFVMILCENFSIFSTLDFTQKLHILAGQLLFLRNLVYFEEMEDYLGVWMKIKILKLCWRKWEKLVSRGSSTAKNPETNRTVTKNTFFKEGDEKCKTQAAKKSSFFHFNHARTRD